MIAKYMLQYIYVNNIYVNNFKVTVYQIVLHHCAQIISLSQMI